MTAKALGLLAGLALASGMSATHAPESVAFSRVQGKPVVLDSTSGLNGTSIETFLRVAEVEQPLVIIAGSPIVLALDNDFE
jgi:hypothetical protein